MWSLAEGIIRDTTERVLSDASRWTNLILKRVRAKNLKLTEDNIRNIGKQENVPDQFIDHAVAALVIV